MQSRPPKMLWHGWEKPSGRAAVRAEYLPRAVPLGALLVGLWLYMDIRHGRKGFRAWLHQVLMAAAVMFFALAWTLRAGILTGHIKL